MSASINLTNVKSVRKQITFFEGFAVHRLYITDRDNKVHDITLMDTYNEGITYSEEPSRNAYDK